MISPRRAGASFSIFPAMSMPSARLVWPGFGTLPNRATRPTATISKVPARGARICPSKSAGRFSNRRSTRCRSTGDGQKEINAYIEYNPDVFKNKVVLLPCDDPEWSNFTKFFAQNFETLGLKKLISTSYAADSKKTEYQFKEEYHQFSIFDMRNVFICSRAVTRSSSGTD